MSIPRREEVFKALQEILSDCDALTVPSSDLTDKLTDRVMLFVEETIQGTITEREGW